MKYERPLFASFYPPLPNPVINYLKSHGRVVIPMAGLALLGAVFAGVVVYQFLHQAALTAKYKDLISENEKLRSESAALKQGWDRLQERLTVLETASLQIADASGIDYPAEIAANSPSAIGRAIGGPDDYAGSEIAELSAAFDSKLDKVGEIFELQQLKLSGTPASWPVRGSITDRFGWRFSPFGRGSESHSGLDISASFGAPVQATADGHVVYAGPQGGYGNLIEIDHGFGLATRYGHLSRISVRIGDHVNRGSMIGAVGTTGRSTGPHCHYEVRLHGVPVNPIKYIAENDKPSD
jgi:murein DD-endopeptidase MepM/ murein hydrolase activator NlpD